MSPLCYSRMSRAVCAARIVSRPLGPSKWCANMLPLIAIIDVDSRIKALYELYGLRLILESYGLPTGYWRIGLARHVNRARRFCEKAGVPVDLRIKLTGAMVGDLDGVAEVEEWLSVVWVIIIDGEEVDYFATEEEAEEHASEGMYEIDIVKREIKV